MSALTVGTVDRAALRLLAKRRAGTTTPFPPADWPTWLTTLFAGYVGSDYTGFADYHAEAWEWTWALTPGVRPAPFVGIWPRDGGKSVSAELACVATAARQARSYALYISETQAKADDHVQNIAGMLESPTFAQVYPLVASRAVGKYGASKGWRRNRLRTTSGFTIDALGLDAAARGARVDEDRPGLIVLDDLDDANDSATVVDRKLTTLTQSILPTGGAELAVLAVQNLIHPESIFARLADGRATFLADRVVSGPHPALRHLAYEERNGRFVLVAGEPTWARLSLARCQEIVSTIGLSAFLAEHQHDVQVQPGGMFDHLAYRHCTWDELPALVRIVVWVDPAVTDTDQSDAHGIQADGLASDGTIYRLWSWEDRTSPVDSLQRAIRKALELGADHVGVETDQGGDTWQSTYREAARGLGVLPPPFRSAKAGQGHGSKTHRASQMLADYERGRIVHVLGTHDTLERALRRFPRTKPYDLVDTAYWGWYELRRGSTTRVSSDTLLRAATVQLPGVV